jgi:hypothetical protein
MQLPSGVAWQRMDENEERNKHHPKFLDTFYAHQLFCFTQIR